MLEVWIRGAYVLTMKEKNHLGGDVRNLSVRNGDIDDHNFHT